MNKNTTQTHIWSRITLLIAVAFVVLHFSAFRVFAAAEDGTTPETAYTTKAALAADIKGKLLERATTSNRIYFVPEGTKVSSLEQLRAYIDDLYDLAMEHDNTNPKAGDYIRENLVSHGFSSYGIDAGGNCFIILSASYLADASKESLVYAELDGAVESLNLDSLTTDLEKAKAVYAYVRDNVTYDYTYTKHSTYDAAIGKNSVCQGYASMLYYMMLKARIDCRVICGEGNGGPHAWNIIKLDDTWYNVDVTFDSSAQTNGFMFFLFSDDSFATDDYGNHIRGNGLDDEGRRVGLDYTSSAFKSKHPTTAADNPFVSLTSVSLHGCSAFLNSWIILKFEFYVPDGAEDALVTLRFPEDGDLYDSSVLVRRRDKVNGYRTFQCRVPARFMADTITAQVSFGNNKSEEFTLSVKAYAMAVFNSTAKKSDKEWIVSMLTYGAYSQLYFNHNTGTLANADLTINPVTDTNIPVPVGYDRLGRNFTKPSSAQGITYDSSSLLLKYGVSLRHYFILDNPSALDEYSFTVNGASVKPVVSGQYVYIQTNNISASNLNADQIITVTHNSTTAMQFNYTPMDYVKIVTVRCAKGDQTISKELVDVCKALYVYYRLNQKYMGGIPTGDVASQTWQDEYPINLY